MSAILVVDDNEQNRYLLQVVLTASGYDVLEAANGTEALVLARRSLPALIISDILMPQMDGFELCRQCKLDEVLRTTPFVFYTATYTDPRDKALALKLGAARFIIKPVENEEFISIIQEVLLSHKDGQLIPSQPPLEEEMVFYRLYNDALVRKLEGKMIDLERLNRSLIESEERFRNLAENAQDLIYRYDFSPDPGFTYVSPAATALTGYTPEEHYADPELGLKLIYAEDRKLAEAFLQRETLPDEPLVLRWVRKDGQIIWVEQRNTPVYNQEGEQIALEGVVRDITARKQHEHELEAIAAVSAALRVARSSSEMYPVILDQLLSLLAVDGAALVMRATNRNELRAELGLGEWKNLTGESIVLDADLNNRLLVAGRPFLDNDVGKNPQNLSPFLFTSCRAIAANPLVTQGQIIGSVWVGSSRPLNEHDLGLINAIANMAANAIHRAALYEETERRVEQLRALQLIDHSITTSFDIHISLNILLEHTITQLHADAAGVLLYDQATLSLEYAGGRGFRGQNYMRFDLRLGEGQGGLAALKQHAVYIDDLKTCDPPFTRLNSLAGEDFVSYAASPLISKGQIKGVLEVFHRAPFQHNEEWSSFFEALAQQAAIAIDSAQLFENLQRTNMDLTLAYDDTIEGWSHALDLRDKETEGHTLRVAEMTMRLARRMGMAQEELVHVRRGALLHDIGKLGIPDTILLKPDKLSSEEWEIMRRHPQYAYDIIKDIAYLRPALDIPYHHHEKWDGSGYPHGMRGEQIPLAARLFAVIDVWDALTSDRPYRKAWSKEKALDFIREQSGVHFDPTIVVLFLQVIQEEN